MIMNKCIIVHLILSTCYVIISAVNTNGKGLLFGRVITGLDGIRFVPVFIPISWLIHDIHSAKLMGQKVGPNEMMTSDMTPDANGNFKRKSVDYNQIQMEDNEKQINNRNSKIYENPKLNTIMNRENLINKPNIFDAQEDRDLLKDAETRITRQKWMARKKLSQEILSKPSEWPSVTDEPIFTSIEIYDIPGVNRYMGLASNRTVVHKSPETKPTNNLTKSYIKSYIKRVKV